MRIRSADGLLLVTLVLLGGCAMARHRAQVRQGLLVRGLHRDAFLKEWGPPTRTFAQPGDAPVFRTHPFGASWERPVYEIWEYRERATCLTFEGVRLIYWETGKEDCTPRPRPRAERPRAPEPPPYPPFPN
jgi:hypothetical protein